MTRKEQFDALLKEVLSAPYGPKDRFVNLAMNLVDATAKGLALGVMDFETAKEFVKEGLNNDVELAAVLLAIQMVLQEEYPDKVKEITGVDLREL